jgi:hypothetical protein
MCYHGGGVGHLTTCQCNEVLLTDKHTPFVNNTDIPIPVPTEDQLSGTEDEGNAGNDGNEGCNDKLLASATHDTEIISKAGFAAL